MDLKEGSNNWRQWWVKLQGMPCFTPSLCGLQQHEWASSPALSTVKCLLNKRLLRPLKSSSRPHYHSSGVGCRHLAGRSTRSRSWGPSRKIANKSPFSLFFSASPSPLFFIPDFHPQQHKRNTQAPVETGRPVRGLLRWRLKGSRVALEIACEGPRSQRIYSVTQF